MLPQTHEGIVGLFPAAAHQALKGRLPDRLQQELAILKAWVMQLASILNNLYSI